MNKLFDNKSHLYDKYRPNYPDFLSHYFANEDLFDSKKIIAELGVGTGKLTELLINSHMLYAIEPNQQMLDIFRNKYSTNQSIRIINSCAEETLLPDKIIDIIIAAQSFHLFNMDKIKKEIYRIAKPNGLVYIIYYNWDMNNPISHRIRELFYKYRKINKQTIRANINSKSIAKYFNPNKVNSLSLGTFQQNFSKIEFEGSMLSSSYSPVKENHYYNYINEVNEIFSMFSYNGIIHYTFNLEIHKINLDIKNER